MKKQTQFGILLGVALIMAALGALAGTSVWSSKADFNYLGRTAAGTKYLIFDIGSGSANPAIRVSSGQLQFANDGSSWAAFSAGVPTGSFFPYGGSTAPTGYFLVDGSCKSRTTESALFAAIGVTYGICDGSTTFALPPPGVFFRVLDSNGVNDPDYATRLAYVSGTQSLNATEAGTNVLTMAAGDVLNLAPGFSVSGTGIPVNTVVSAILTSTTVQISNAATTSGLQTLIWSKSATGPYPGSYQLDQNLAHTHTWSFPIYQTFASSSTVSQGAGPQTGTASGTTSLSGGNQANPRNMYVNYIIKR